MFQSNDIKHFTLTLIVLVSSYITLINGHVALTYPPARKYDLDFLDNTRTKGPCGMPKGSTRTSFLAGSSINVTWHLAYPHRAHMKFPLDYPYSPPSIRFLTKVWHPNVYENGDLCISILHPPVDDPQSGELPCERWNPTQNIEYSPANVDASVMYRRWRDSHGKDNEYPNIIRKQALAAKAEAEKEGIVVPLTLEDYCIKPKSKPSNQDPPLDMTDFYDEDYDLDTDDDDDEQESNASEYYDGDDSGNGET